MRVTQRAIVHLSKEKWSQCASHRMRTRHDSESPRLSSSSSRNRACNCLQLSAIAARAGQESFPRVTGSPSLSPCHRRGTKGRGGPKSSMEGAKHLQRSRSLGARPVARSQAKALGPRTPSDQQFKPAVCASCACSVALRREAEAVSRARGREERDLVSQDHRRQLYMTIAFTSSPCVHPFPLSLKLVSLSLHPLLLKVFLTKPPPLLFSLHPSLQGLTLSPFPSSYYASSVSDPSNDALISN